MRGNPAASYLGRTYRLFQTANATVRFVLGEFPWQVRSGDVATVSDYVAPPLMLSAEKTPDETTWSIGEYVDGRRLWEAFRLPGSAPRPVGVFANQPSPYAGKPSYYWGLFLILALSCSSSGPCAPSPRRASRSFQVSYLYRPGATDASFVTPIFTIGNRTSNVEVRRRQTSEQLDRLRLCADQRRHRRRVRLLARGQLLLRHRQRRAMDRRIAARQRDAADDRAGTVLPARRARNRRHEPAGLVHGSRCGATCRRLSTI